MAISVKMNRQISNVSTSSLPSHAPEDTTNKPGDNGTDHDIEDVVEHQPITGMRRMKNDVA